MAEDLSNVKPGDLLIVCPSRVGELTKVKTLKVFKKYFTVLGFGAGESAWTFDGDQRPRPQRAFNRFSIRRLTPELERMYERQGLARTFREINPDSLTLDQLRAIVSVALDKKRMIT